MADNLSNPRPDDEVTIEDEAPTSAREDPPVDSPEEAVSTEPVDNNGPFSESIMIEGLEVQLGASNPRDTSSPLVAQLKDHFTLMNPTTTIRYRRATNAARIIEDADKQYILEEADRPVDFHHPDRGHVHEVTIRQLNDAFEGVRFLRTTYLLATAFWTGFLFIFCVQILLFVFLDLAIQFGVSGDKDPSYLAGLGVVLSIPEFVHGLTSALVIAGVYIMDTSRGHPLTRNFTFKRFQKVLVEWVYFFFFIGLPALSLCVTLLTGTDDFWAITGLIWWISIFVFYAIFAFNVVFYEIRACLEVLKNRYKNDSDTTFDLVKRSIYLRQVATYGGYKTTTVVSMGPLESAETTDDIDSRTVIPGTRVDGLSWRAKLTTWQGFLSIGMYEVLEKPEQIFTTDDARDVRPFITSHTWSLEKVFCRPHQSRYVAILQGPGALTRAQMRSSVACSVVGSSIIFFLVLSLLVYLKAGAVATIFLLIIGVALFLPNLKSTYRLWKVMKNLIKVRSENKDTYDDTYSGSVRDIRFSARDRGLTNIGAEESEGLYLTTTRYRVTKPSRWFAFTMFGVEFFFLFFWPTVSYFAIGNWRVGLLFIILVGATAARYYLNAALVLEETGQLDLLDGNSEKEKWTAQSRLDDIVGNITRGRSIGVWSAVLRSFGLIFLALFAGAVGSGQEDISEGFDVPFIYVQNDLFQYKQINALRYPSCSLTADLGDSPLESMADFAYLAGHAYRGTGISQEELDQWFNGTVTDEVDYVKTLRSDTVDSRVSFKLVTTNTSETGAFAYLVIRGTTNQWDAMTDAQLWAPAALMQFLRIALPFGHIWTPVIPYMLSAMTVIESESIEQISFYKDTVDFVEYLKASPRFNGVAITGHSLGGGLSIITGAITQTPAVALSGPNAMLSRRAFDPQLDPNDLDRFTFNIVPERDIVPMFDDKAQNYQMIRCQGEFADVAGCHTALRSLCEIIFTCGSGNRPVICECVTDFGYPEPVRVTDENITFEEACRASAEARGAPPPVFT